MINGELKKQIRSQTAGYMAGALGLVAGLAWNDAIKSLIDLLFPFAKTGIFAKFIYAIVITGVVVLVGMYLLENSASTTKK